MENQALSEPRCPACNCVEVLPIGGKGQAFETFAGGETFKHPEYRIFRCSDCSLYYKFPSCDLETLSSYYENLEFESYEFNGLFPTDRIVIRILDSLPDRARVLDFGCGVGRILSPYAKRLDCHGVEVNARASAVAVSRGIAIHQEEELLAESTIRFDAIILTDVFEHLVHPFHLIERLAKFLNSGGRLIIVTGNADAIPIEEISAEFWYYRILGHLQMASIAHFEWMASKLGLELDNLIPTCHYSHTPGTILRQRLQNSVYAMFVTRPNSWTAKLTRYIPILGRAANWTTAPCDTTRQDHLVATFINRRNGNG